MSQARKRTKRTADRQPAGARLAVARLKSCGRYGGRPRLSAPPRTRARTGSPSPLLCTYTSWAPACIALRNTGRPTTCKMRGRGRPPPARSRQGVVQHDRVSVALCRVASPLLCAIGRPPPCPPGGLLCSIKGQNLGCARLSMSNAADIVLYAWPFVFGARWRLLRPVRSMTLSSVASRYDVGSF